MFYKIVLPLIVPSITIISVLTIIGSLNVFEQVYTMAGLDGPPNYATDTIGTLFYRTAFGSVDSGAPEIGIGSAIAVVIYLMTSAFRCAPSSLPSPRRWNCEHRHALPQCKPRKKVFIILLQLVMLTYVLLIIYPLFNMVMSSFKSTRDIMLSPFSLPESFSFENLRHHLG